MPFLNRSRKQPAGILGVKENRRGFILLSALVVLILLVAVLAPAITPAGSHRDPHDPGL